MTKDTFLNQGIAFLEVGERERAHHLFLQAVEQDPQNALAWLWLSKVVISTAERRNCLENALLLDPKILVRQQEEFEEQSVMDMARSFPTFQTTGTADTHAASTAPPSQQEGQPPSEPQSQPDYDHIFFQQMGESASFPTFQSATEVEQRFKSLQAIGEVYKVLGLILGALTLVAAIGLFVLSTMGNTTIIVTNPAPSNLWVEVFDGLLGSLFVIIAGGSVSATLYAAGEGVYLLLTMEKHSRTTTILLQKLYKLIQKDQEHKSTPDGEKAKSQSK